ncbi:GntP family permease [Caproicibacter sp.]|uniref:GntP family permease n=1 Tax=Caproicibacter sp. TaxID=2814884 RepID=UPI0039895B35
MISIIALLIGIALLIFLVVKTKIQAFPALILSAIVIGLLSGLSTDKTISAVTKGFGNTLGSIGIVIGLGCIMGKFMEKSGAVKRMALTILKRIGIKRADVVLGITGLLVSIPVFCDSGFVILSSLAKEFSRLTRKSMILMGGLLGMGLYITHFLVPPTPGPLAVCGAFGIDIGEFILYGVLLAIPLFLVAVFYFRWVAKKNPDIIPEMGEEDFSQLSADQRAALQKIEAKQKSGRDLTNDDFNELLKDEAMPGTFISFATLLVPILLILTNTVLGFMKVTGPVKSFFTLFGSPVCALFISVLMGVYLLCGKMPKGEALKTMESALADGGLIVFVTGAGGALGGVISATGVGTLMAKSIVAAGLPAILVPLLVGTLLRFPQGSGTAAMVTGASILAPMLPTLGINPVLAGLALCSTAMCPSYMNDSYFWVVTRFSGFDEKTSLKTWTPATVLIPLVSSVILILVSVIF